ncbi:MAG: fibronectin type III domain-containing protein [Treponema sp.]|nr:fibronectin type III domain-containing protein [Treponema sp.]
MKKVTECCISLPARVVLFFYCFLLAACSNEVSSSSDNRDTTGVTSLTTPTGFCGDYNPYTNQAVFTWNAVAGADGYKIYWNTTNDFSTALIDVENTTANEGFTLYGFSAAVTTYYYWVAAFSSSLPSTHSSSISITTSAVSPENLRVTSGDGLTFSIAWNAVAGITGYVIYAGKTNDPSTAEKTESIETNSVPVTLNGTECPYGTPVYIWVTSKKGETESDFGSPVVYTPAAPTVSAPSITLVQNDNSATLSWSAVTGCTGYKVYIGTTSDPDQAVLSQTLIDGTTTAVVSAENSGIKYYVWVTAFLTQNDLTYESAFGDPLTFYQPLPATEMITTTGAKTESSIDLSWLAVTGASKYAVYYGTTNNTADAVKFSAATADLSLTVTGLTSGTTYYFWVRAVDAYDDEGEFSDSTQSKTRILAPQNVSLSIIEDTSVVISWSASTGATSYTVAYGMSDSLSDASKITDCTGLSKNITGLSEGTRYYFWVNAVDSATSYETSYSLPVSGNTLPARPVGLTVSGYTSESVTLCWTAIPGAATYRVCYNTTNTGSSSVKFGTTADTSITVTGLSGGITYYFWVQAYYNGTWSSLSDSVSQNTSGNQDTPGTGTKVWMSGTVSASGSRSFIFSAVSGNTYTVYWDDLYNGSGSYTCDVKVSAYMGSTNYFTDVDSGYITGRSFTPSCDGTVYIKVQPWSSGSGTFAVAVMRGTSNVTVKNQLLPPVHTGGNKGPGFHPE